MSVLTTRELHSHDYLNCVTAPTVSQSPSPARSLLLYLDCFTVLTVSPSQPYARIFVSAAEGISAFNVALVYVRKHRFYHWASA